MSSIYGGKKLYAFYDSTSGVILQKPTELPRLWINPLTGEQYNNLNILSKEELKSIGWYPFNDTIPEFDNFFYTITIDRFQFDSTNEEIKINAIITEKDLEEVRYNMYVKCDETKSMIQECGIVWNGNPIDTRRKSMNKFNSEAARFASGKRNDGDIFQTLNSFKRLTNIEFESIGDLITTFFTNTYLVAESFWNEITNAQDINTLKDIKTRIEDKTSWPQTYL